MPRYVKPMLATLVSKPFDRPGWIFEIKWDGYRAIAEVAVKPRTNAPATWVIPKLVCEIAFQNWTRDGRVRQPIFLGLRPDKSAGSVRREKPKRLDALDRTEKHSSIGVAR
jgi:ATP-dependent DNA ligase